MDGFDEVVMACRPMDVEAFKARSAALGFPIPAALASDLEPVPGSTPANCQDCGEKVGVGPKQNELLAMTPKPGIYCLICGTLRTIPADEVVIHDLGGG